MLSRKKIRVIVLFVLAFAIFSGSVMANVVVFDKYETTLTLEGDTLKVEKRLRLMNIGSNPIIPGEIHFKLSTQAGDEIIPADIRNLKIADHYDHALDTQQVKGNEELDVVFTLWNPLLPSFYYDFKMSYEMDFDPKGILFYEINVPQEKTTINIKNQKTSFLLPKRFHVTFAPDAEVTTEDGARVLTWFNTPNLDFEYSYLPLPRVGVRMVNVFWVLLIAISLVYLVVRFVRARKPVDVY